MKTSYEIYEYEEKKLYNFTDVVDKFKDYYGITIEQMEYLLKSYPIYPWSELINELKKHNHSITEKELNDKEISYNYYQTILFNLSIKGIELINIIKYLKTLSTNHEENIIYEKKLNTFEIYHYSSILKGKDINRILKVVHNLLLQFDNSITNINSINTYLNSNSNIWMLNTHNKKYIPNKKLAVFDDEYDKNLSDKTSFIMRRRRII